MNEIDLLWKKFAQSKEYRESFVSAQVKSGIPFQIRKLMDQENLSQKELALQAGMTQGVVSRAADPEYGNLTLNTIIRIAAGFDVAFVGKFVPFSELAKWLLELPEAKRVDNFTQEQTKRTGRPAHPTGLFIVALNGSELGQQCSSTTRSTILDQGSLLARDTHQRQPNAMLGSQVSVLASNSIATSGASRSPGSLLERGTAGYAGAA